MYIKELLDLLYQYAPKELALEYDNVGLILGSIEREITNIFITIDVTLDSLNKAKESKCNTIISHHPMIFHGIKTIISGEKDEITYAIKNDINIIALHTNFDDCVNGNNEGTLNVLGFKIIGKAPCLRIGEIESPITYAKLLENCKSRLYYKNLRLIPTNRVIKRIGVCTGSGGDLETFDVFLNNNVDCVITSEVKHNVALEYKKRNIGLIEPDHYSCELIFVDLILKYLSKIADKQFNLYYNDKGCPYSND